VLRAQEWREFDGVAGSGHHGLGEDDGIAELGRVWVVGYVGSRIEQGAQRCRLREDDVVAGSGIASWAWARGLHCRWRHRLRSGKMVARKGLDHGRQRRCRGSREDTTMAWRLRGGHDDDTCSGEVNDGVSSREIFGGKFWQPDGVSESLRGLGFAKIVQ
jgi:hypothetical protein